MGKKTELKHVNRRDCRGRHKKEEQRSEIGTGKTKQKSKIKADLKSPSSSSSSLQ